jgi:TetR/AcrR family transcriptional regulator
MSPADRHEKQSTQTRERLLDAALIEFSACGFEGASTRDIAARAGCHQPQINYHFESKEALWEATMTRLFAEIALEFASLDSITDPVSKFESTIHRFVHYAARRPELNRIMVAEAMAQTQRLKWIVDNFSNSAYHRLLGMWRDVRAAGHGADIDERLVYHLFIGAASLLWANAPEMQLIDPSISRDDANVVQAHVEALILLFLPNQQRRDSTSSRTNSTKLSTKNSPKRKAPK